MPPATGMRTYAFTYRGASCQVRVSTAERPQNQASQPLFEYTTSELAGDRAMLASNPSTEPEAEMRESRTPDLPSPARPIPSRHQAPNAGVRGRAPSRDLLPVHLPLRTTFVPLRSGLRSSVREVTYSPKHQQEHSFVTGFAFTEAAFSRREQQSRLPVMGRSYPS
jgi:hypothetical protein